MNPLQLAVCEISVVFQGTAKHHMVPAALGHVLVEVDWFTLKGKK